MKIKFLFVLLLGLLITNCGYKVINQSELINFFITDLDSSGDNRVNYKIKNKLLIYGKDKAGLKPIKINLNKNKTKTIKEKNIKNEVTKYWITINVNVEVKDRNNATIANFSVNHRGDYDVASQYFKTLNSEKRLIELLSEKLKDKIITSLINELNDL